MLLTLIWEVVSRLSPSNRHAGELAVAGGRTVSFAIQSSNIIMCQQYIKRLSRIWRLNVPVCCIIGRGEGGWHSGAAALAVEQRLEWGSDRGDDTSGKGQDGWDL